MRDLTKYRIESATERLDVAEETLLAGHYNDSISRSYYAIFTAIRALLAEREVDFQKHSGVISYFRREYIKTGIFDKKFSDYLKNAYDSRNECDYGDYIAPTKEDAEVHYAHAKDFVAAVKDYLVMEYGR